MSCKYSCAPRCKIACTPTSLKGPWVLDKAAFALIKEAVDNTKHEVAGVLHLGPGHTLQFRGPFVEGERDAVDVPHGMVEFHTHPSKCSDSSKDCGIDVPSPEDIGLLLYDLFNGTLVHMVFASTGTYVMQAQPALVKRIKEGGDAYVRALVGDFERLFEEEPPRWANLGNDAFLIKFRKAWMALARRYKLKCVFTKPSTPPRVRL